MRQLLTTFGVLLAVAASLAIPIKEEESTQLNNENTQVNAADNSQQIRDKRSPGWHEPEPEGIWKKKLEWKEEWKQIEEKKLVWKTEWVKEKVPATKEVWVKVEKKIWVDKWKSVQVPVWKSHPAWKKVYKPVWVKVWVPIHKEHHGWD